MIELKNIQDKRHLLGQFFTPTPMVRDVLDKLPKLKHNIIEPSFGGGSFLNELRNNNPEANIIGIELDDEWFNKFSSDSMTLLNVNFYDFNEIPNGDVSFVGNVPFRTPAFSLETHPKYVKQLAHKYNVTGIREEAVFFIIKTIDLLLSNNLDGDIHYIIPASLIKNDSKFYKRFKEFLKQYMTILGVYNVNPQDFDNVAQDLIMLSMKIGGNQENYNVNLNGVETPVDTVLNLDSTDIPFQNIFKNTYLGSVPAESFLVSSKDEPLESFIGRLIKIMNNPHDVSTLANDLYYNNQAFLKMLNGEDSEKIELKLGQISQYIDGVKNKVNLSIFEDVGNYHPIQHRHSTRFYFRSKEIKKCGFVYELNPNPCRSFYFTSNPSDTSTDYFGFCEFDITRNSSPGCCRTIPLDNFEDNIHDDFKQYWVENTHRPLSDIPHYIMHVAKSDWYKQQKKIKKRMYFCIPLEFMKSFNAAT